jgi:hypothetical protein
MDDLYGLLDSFGLNDSAGLEKRLADWEDEEFERFFQVYDEAARSRALVYIPKATSTSIFADSVAGKVPSSLLRQLCIYADRFYIHDPILPLQDSFRRLDSEFPRIISSQSHKGRLARFRDEVRKDIKSILEVRPLADAGILHITPSALLRSRSAPGAIYASEFYGPKGQFSVGDDIQSPAAEYPPALGRYVNDHLVVTGFRFDKKGVPIIENQLSGPTNSIAIRFDDGVSPSIYCLADVQPGGASTESHYHFRMYYDYTQTNSPPDKPTFYHWMVGESRKYVRGRMQDLETDLTLASLAEAHFLTPFQSSRDLATINLSKEPTSNPVLSTLLKVNLPYLSGVSLQDLANARANEAAFNDFRMALDKAFSKIESFSEEQRHLETDRIIRDLLDAPLGRLDKQLKALANHTGIQAVLLLGSLAATTISGLVPVTTALLGAAAVAAAAYRKEKGEQEKLKEHPSFFYWDVTKNARNRNGSEARGRRRSRKK